MEGVDVDWRGLVLRDLNPILTTALLLHNVEMGALGHSVVKGRAPVAALGAAGPVASTAARAST